MERPNDWTPEDEEFAQLLSAAQLPRVGDYIIAGTPYVPNDTGSTLIALVCGFVTSVEPEVNGIEVRYKPHQGPCRTMYVTLKDVLQVGFST